MAELTADFVKNLRIVLDPETVEDLQDGFVGEEDNDAVNFMDKAIAESKSTRALVLYRGYDGVQRLPAGFTDGAFWVGSESPIKADTVVRKSVSIGADALEIGDGLWILPRDTKHQPSSSTPQLTILTGEELFNHHHAKDGKFGSGLSGKYGKIGDKASRTKEQQDNREKLKSALKKAAVAIAVVAVVAALLVEGTTQSKADNVHLEAKRKLASTSESDQVAAHTYTLKAGVLINQFLRGAKVTLPPGVKDIDEVMKKEIGSTRAELVSKVDSAFVHASVPAKGVRVYRGMQRDAEWIKSIKTGDVIHDEGYQSTTTSKMAAVNYAKGWGGTNTGGGTGQVVMKIKTHDGTRVMAGIAERGNEELVLNRGSGLKITRVRHCAGGVCKITAETID